MLATLPCPAKVAGPVQILGVLDGFITSLPCSCLTSAMVTSTIRLMIFTCRKQCRENRICTAPAALPQELQEVIVLYETVCAPLDCL